MAGLGGLWPEPVRAGVGEVKISMIIRQLFFLFTSLAALWVFGFVGLLVAAFVFWLIRKSVYAHGLWQALDRFGSALFGLDARYTISAHAGMRLQILRHDAPRWAKFVRWWTDKIEKDHVFKSAISEGLLPPDPRA